MIPNNGLILKPDSVPAIEETLAMGCWTAQQSIGKDWLATLSREDGSEFDVRFENQKVATVNWSLIGEHNVHNALMAIAAARNVGVSPETAAEALSSFKNVKRRMELRGETAGIKVYDDFAHHPTAIATTLAGLRAKVKQERIVAILEPRSNTMKMGVHKAELIASLQEADEICLLQPDNISWNLSEFADASNKPLVIFDDLESMIQHIINSSQTGDHLLVMSNGGFGGIHTKLLERLGKS